jgi:hypothetical protein
MAVTKTTTITALAGVLVVDFRADSSSENNVTGNSSGTLYLVDVDNRANPSQSAYVRIRDASSATPSHATNGVPTWVFMAPPGAKMSYAMPEGQAYSAGLSMWCTVNNAKQNISSPTNAVVVKLVAS